MSLLNVSTGLRCCQHCLLSAILNLKAPPAQARVLAVLPCFQPTSTGEEGWLWFRFAQPFGLTRSGLAEHIGWRALTERYIREYLDWMDALHVKRATQYPRVTEEVDGIIDATQILIAKGYAYDLKGDVYYCVSRKPEYSELKHQSLDELRAGARVEIVCGKAQMRDLIQEAGRTYGICCQVLPPSVVCSRNGFFVAIMLIAQPVFASIKLIPPIEPGGVTNCVQC